MAFKQTHRLSETSFERSRKLPFHTLVSYFLNLNKGSYQQELDNYFAVFEPESLPSQAVTKSALTQARKNLSHTAFTELNHLAVESYYGDHNDLKTWHGHRLCAIDGSQIRLPDEEDIVSEFGVNPGKPSQKDCPLALASVYYDVLNHIAIDASINPTTASERECAVEHLHCAQPNDLSILDRGYNAYWLYAFYQANSLPFCMRAKVNLGKPFKAFAQSGQSQDIITLKPNKRSIEQCNQKGLPTQPLRLRLIRVELDSGVEVLITNLFDEQLYPASEFKHLYHLRWGIEENYKRLKQWVEIENFTGKSALSVRQDFYAKVLSSNLASMVVNAAQKRVDKKTFRRKLPYRVNFAQALSKMKNTIVELLTLTSGKWQSRLDALIEYISCTMEAVRPDRSYQRIKRRPNKQPYYMNYKRAK